MLKRRISNVKMLIQNICYSSVRLSPRRLRVLAYFASPGVTVSASTGTIQMDQFIKKLESVVNAVSSKGGDEEFELPDIAKLGKEISEEALTQIDNAITDLKKKIGK